MQHDNLSLYINEILAIKNIVGEKMAESKWIIDRQHSSLEFSVRHMMISHVSGKFNEFSIDASEDIENVENSTVNVIINATSVDTGNIDRDNHLKSPDFLNAPQFPNIIFKSRKK
ncbi:Lipid/polyisoprenoid-binding, YceI-like protein [mine drainage metagenome]|uniref:Lipid/polyisoprenoid-binding, YceI-like protein n=1 Tax=mine drainage metagenome TaxID=410659 RepID=T1D137_9ZZZZ